MIEWEKVTINKLVQSKEAELQTGPFGKQLKASEYVNEGIPVVNVKNIGYGTVVDNKLDFLSTKTAERLHVHRLEVNDIIFGRKGAVDRHAFITEKQSGWIQGSDCLKLRIKSARVCNKFLSYYFTTDAHKSWMEAQCSFGATMSSLNQDIVKRISIPLPPLPIQRKIAAVLSAYDDLIENNTRRIAILEQMVEEIYREWFVRMRFPGHERVNFHKGIPEEWKEVSVEQIIQRVPVGKKYEQKTASNKGLIPILDQGQSGLIGYHNNEPGVMASIDNPVIVFANHTCYQRLIGFPFSAIQNVLPFIPNPKMYTDIFWLHYATKNIIEFTEYKGHWPEFIKKKLYYPSINLTIEFGRVIKPIHVQAYKLEKLNSHLTISRDLLLSRLMSGKLAVDDLDIRFPKGIGWG